MVDLRKTIAPKSDQTNADDFISGPRTIQIRGVEMFQDGDRERANIFYNGDDGKPWKPCVTTMRLLIGGWGTESDDFIGKKVTLYRDPNVKFGGAMVGGIRISHMSHMEIPLIMSLTKTRGKKETFKIDILEEDAPPEMDMEVLDAAREAAMKGTAELVKFWADTPHKRMLKAEMDKPKTGLKAIAAEVELESEEDL